MNIELMPGNECLRRPGSSRVRIIAPHQGKRKADSLTLPQMTSWNGPPHVLNGLKKAMMLVEKTSKQKRGLL